MRHPINIVIATDKFKGSLTAQEASVSISNGLKRGVSSVLSLDEIKILQIPLADGGEGFLSVAGRNGFYKRREAEIIDPLGRTIKSHYLLSEKDPVAVIEMALASGLGLLEKEEYNPVEATSFGFGQLILHAIKDGVSEIIAGIGGSATNDGGTGMLQALGYTFRDKSGEVICGEEDQFMSGSLLSEIFSIDDSGAERALKRVRITVACDVDNPLLGADGATYVYAKQKGADESDLIKLEAGMRNFAEVSERHLGFNSCFLCDSSSYVGYDFSDFPGSGAAGGVGYALRSFLKADLIPGWRVAATLANVEEAISKADLIISGEGRLDKQTLSGKLVDGISILANRYRKPYWVYCGENNLSEEELKVARISKVFEISPNAKNLNDSISRAKQLLEKISAESATFLSELQSNRQTN